MSQYTWCTFFFIMKKLFIMLSIGIALSGCSEDPNIALRDAYLETGEQVATDLVEVGTQLETLMNVQNDVFAWSDAEKQELDSIQQKVEAIQATVDSMKPSVEFSEAHPFLVATVAEMSAAVLTLEQIAQDPTAATEDVAQELEEYAVNIESFGNDFVDSMDAAIEKLDM